MTAPSARIYTKQNIQDGLLACKSNTKVRVLSVNSVNGVTNAPILVTVTVRHTCPSSYRTHPSI